VEIAFGDPARTRVTCEYVIHGLCTEESLRCGTAVRLTQVIHTSVAMFNDCSGASQRPVAKPPNDDRMAGRSRTPIWMKWLRADTLPH